MKDILKIVEDVLECEVHGRNQKIFRADGLQESNI